MSLRILLLISSFIAVLSEYSVSAQTFIIVRHGETLDDGSNDEDKVVLVSTHGHVLPLLVKNLTGTDIPHTGCEYDHLVTIKRQDGEATVMHGRYGNRTPACEG